MFFTYVMYDTHVKTTCSIADAAINQQLDNKITKEITFLHCLAQLYDKCFRMFSAESCGCVPALDNLGYYNR